MLGQLHSRSNTLEEGQCRSPSSPSCAMLSAPSASRFAARKSSSRTTCRCRRAALSQPALAEWKEHSIFRGEQWTIGGFKCVPGDYAPEGSGVSLQRPAAAVLSLSWRSVEWLTLPGPRNPPDCDPDHVMHLERDASVGMIKQRGSISCPPYSTFFTANTAVPASPKCGNSFFLSRLRAIWLQEQIAMSVIPAIPLVGMVLANSARTAARHEAQPHSLSARSQPANGGALDKLRSLAWCGRI